MFSSAAAPRSLGGPRRLLASPTLRFAPGRLVPAAIAFLATPVLARVLDRQDFGVLAVLQAVALLAGSVVFGWSEATIVRRFSGPGKVTGADISPLVVPVLAGVVILGVSGAAAAIVAAFPLAALTAAAAVGSAATLAATALARARQAPRAFFLAAVAGGCTRYLVGVPLVALGAGLWALFASWALGGVLAVGIAATLVARPRRIRFGAPTRQDVLFGGPLVAVQAGLLAVALVDRLLLSAFLPAAEIAPYALGYALVDQAATLVFSILLAVRFPRMLRIHDEEGPVAARMEFERAFGIFFSVAVPVLLGLALFGGDVARTLGGPAYAVADFAFVPVVAAALLLHGIHQYLTVPLQQARRTGPWALAVALAVAVNVIANLALIPILGTLGAGVATLLGYAALVAVLAWTVRRQVSLPLTVMLATAVAAAAALVAAALTAGMPWPLSAGFAVASFLATSVAARRMTAAHGR